MGIGLKTTTLAQWQDIQCYSIFFCFIFGSTCQEKKECSCLLWLKTQLLWCGASCFE